VLSGETDHSRPPIVIIGGFLSFTSLYGELAETLRDIAGTSVSIVPTRSADWLGAAFPIGWLPLLRRLDRTVRASTSDANSDQVTLVAHSAGGVLARIYLSAEPFFGTTFRGLDVVTRLITLGTPHDGGGKLIYGGVMSGWANQRYPGAFYADQVTYVSVAGRSVAGNPTGTPQERRAYRAYRGMTEDGLAWGDGVVPVGSALLSGAKPVILDGVGHFEGFGPAWYGSREIVPQWWSVASATD